jgi:protein-S-isoprenylcysteine O-methyltransferase Ste14
MILVPWLAHLLLPQDLSFHSGFRTWLAGVLAVSGIAGWIVCLETFSGQGGGTPLAADAPRELVTTRLFSQIRNPIMVSELCIIWAEALYIASLGTVLYGLAISLAARMLVVHIEEPELRKRFGESYAEYCRNVPRWFPALLPRQPDDERARR